jgi:hypothetical protein
VPPGRGGWWPGRWPGNAPAVRFFYDLGFDALGQLELLLDLRPPGEQRWRVGATIADRDLKV